VVVASHIFYFHIDSRFRFHYGPVCHSVLIFHLHFDPGRDQSDVNKTVCRHIVATNCILVKPGWRCGLDFVWSASWGSVRWGSGSGTVLHLADCKLPAALDLSQTRLPVPLFSPKKERGTVNGEECSDDNDKVAPLMHKVAEISARAGGVVVLAFYGTFLGTPLHEIHLTVAGIKVACIIPGA